MLASWSRIGEMKIDNYPGERRWGEKGGSFTMEVQIHPPSPIPHP